jgi:hypothetical protein
MENLNDTNKPSENAEKELRISDVSTRSFIDNFGNWTIKLSFITSSLCELTLSDENGKYQGAMITPSRRVINDNMYDRLLEHAMLIKNGC